MNEKLPRDASGSYRNAYKALPSKTEEVAMPIQARVALRVVKIHNTVHVHNTKLLSVAINTASARGVEEISGSSSDNTAVASEVKTNPPIIAATARDATIQR